MKIVDYVGNMGVWFLNFGANYLILLGLVEWARSAKGTWLVVGCIVLALGFPFFKISVK